MKTAILNKLTSSKNERKAFACIWDLTRGRGKGNCIIKHADFADHGLPYRNRRNEAVIRLMKKGIIARIEEDAWWHNGAEGRVFRYAVKNWGCVRFLLFVNSDCFDCLKMVKK